MISLHASVIVRSEGIRYNGHTLGGRNGERLFPPDFFQALQACVPFLQNNLKQGKQLDQMDPILAAKLLSVTLSLCCFFQLLEHLVQQVLGLCRMFDGSLNCKAGAHGPSNSTGPEEISDYSLQVVFVCFPIGTNQQCSARPAISAFSHSAIQCTSACQRYPHRTCKCLNIWLGCS